MQKVCGIGRVQVVLGAVCINVQVERPRPVRGVHAYIGRCSGTRACRADLHVLSISESVYTRRHTAATRYGQKLKHGTYISEWASAYT